MDNKIFTSSKELHFESKLRSGYGIVVGICLQEGFQPWGGGLKNISRILPCVWVLVIEYVTVFVVRRCSVVDVDLAQIASGLVMKVSIDLV